MDKTKFNFISSDQQLDKEQVRKSLTYWQDVWRRLRKNRLAVLGLIGVILVFLFAVVGPMIHPIKYSDFFLDFKNIPPRLEVYELDDDLFVYMGGNLHLILVDEDGHLLERFERGEDLAAREYTYTLEDNDDISIVAKFTPTNTGETDYKILYDGEEFNDPDFKVWNKSFILGTDINGRDLLSRVMYGTGISLIIAFVAAIINLFIGVVYGSVSGYAGGTTDIVMMRIVDIINSIPLLLYVILLSVVLKESWFEQEVLNKIFGTGGLGNIILTLVTVYWVGMARLVRGQILGLKEQEYILAARTIGVSDRKIIAKHLVPNALGPIIVSMTMMIPSAVFTEAFLSFIGLGISAPKSSLGSLANTGKDLINTYPYQLVIPALVIAFMMLSFNFLGDGLRDALDPRLRKG